jgi:hypothetical protein
MAATERVVVLMSPAEKAAPEYNVASRRTGQRSVTHHCHTK